jgi:hypothetical protein
MRIEINPTGYEKHYHWSHGDGWPTIDVCTSCVHKFPVGKELDDDFPGVVSENDVEHPPYDDSVYNCAICGITLTEGD